MDGREFGDRAHLLVCVCVCVCARACMHVCACTYVWNKAGSAHICIY